MTKPTNVTCPECDGEMVPRTSEHGKFWGCKAYPKCKGTRDSNGDSKYDRARARQASGQNDYEDIGPDPFTHTNGVNVTFNKKERSKL